MRWGDKPKGTELPDSAREEREPRLSGGGTNDRLPSDDHGGDDSGHNEDGRLSYRDRLMRWRLGLGLSLLSLLALACDHSHFGHWVSRWTGDRLEHVAEGRDVCGGQYQRLFLLCARRHACYSPEHRHIGATLCALE